jgi:hypothetical protein
VPTSAVVYKASPAALLSHTSAAAAAAATAAAAAACCNDDDDDDLSFVSVFRHPSTVQYSATTRPSPIRALLMPHTKMWRCIVGGDAG